MTMTAEAINRIEQLASAAARLDYEGIEDGSTPLVVLPKDMEVKDLEVFAPRRRFRGKFTTDNVASFASYVRIAPGDWEGESVPCFIDAQAAVATMILDVGTTKAPGHCDHMAGPPAERVDAENPHE